MGPTKEPRFTGNAGQTRTRTTTVWCGGCGVRFGAAWWVSLDADAEPARLRAFLDEGYAALNLMDCPECGWSHVAEEPLAVHLPLAARFFLVLPAALRHRAESARADLIATVASGPGAILPDYARDPELVVGPDGLAAALGSLGGSASLDAAFASRADDDDLSAHEATRVRRVPMPPADDDAAEATGDRGSNTGRRDGRSVPEPAASSARTVAAPMPQQRHAGHDEPSMVDVDFAAAGLAPVVVGSMPPTAMSEPSSLPLPAPRAPTPPNTPAKGAGPALGKGGSATPVKGAGPALGKTATSSRGTAQVAGTGTHGARTADLEPVAPEPDEDRLAAVVADDGGAEDPWAEVEPRERTPAAPAPTGGRPPLPVVGRAGGLLSAVLADAPLAAKGEDAGAEPTTAEPDGSGEADEGGFSDLDRAWGAPGDEGGIRRDEEATHVVSLDSVNDGRALPGFDHARSGGAEAYLALETAGVRAVVRLDAPRHAAFEVDLSTTLRFQLHQPVEGPAVTLLLVREADGEAVDTVVWVIDPDEPEHAEILAQLERRFSVEVQFYDGEAEPLGRRVFRAPLEANVTAARKALDEVNAGARSAACAVVAGAGYDIVGRLRHNFTEDSFSTCGSASEARLALGILSYWSAPERLDYLLRIRSFPEIWFEEMSRRVLSSALRFGLFMEPHLRQRTLELGVAPHAAELLQTALSNFALVTLNLRPSGLDALDTWENWEQLLTLAEELDLRVGEDLERVAAQAMERARMAAQDGEAIDIDADASVEVEEITDLLEPDEHAQIARLNDPNTRIEAALTLLSRGESAHVPAVFAAMKVMSRDALERVVPATLARGPAFEAHFIAGLRSRRTSLRLACALALGEIRSERAARPLLEWVRRGPASEWKLVARAAARIGRRILAPALAVVTAENDPEGRIAHTLALLGTEARGALAAARGTQASEAANACLAQALENLGRVGFGDAADFAERLVDAFAHAGPDLVGPDYEEDLFAGQELGPSAQGGHGETDVDLEDLDPDGRSRG